MLPECIDTIQKVIKKLTETSLLLSDMSSFNTDKDY